MERCTNCNSLIICNCVKKTASDGATVCASCLGAYEDKIKTQVKPS